MNTKLKELREVIIAAVDSNRADQLLGKVEVVCTDGTKIAIPSHFRLADVLLAMRGLDDTEKFIGWRVGTCGDFWHEKKGLLVNAEWNLSKNSLAEQSPETIDWLHEVLVTKEI